ncbi:MAG: adenosylcobalamin-dependent ribonucleoside-diphosphate reductase [Candidatus Colwellbacteria bacterium]|nr:adenosylcobalamin-dependent ribonucleoside-diphosphate reductase [Candidatus Colwellbacteria bacterium]
MSKKATLDDKKINQSFSENALKMMKKRYLIADDKGNKETPAQMFRRVAGAIAKVEKKYGRDSRFIKKVEKDFFEVLANQEFTPAGRTLTNAGGETPLIANCIVLPIRDSMEGIFQTLKEAALLQQAGSGLGFAFDSLRPAMSVTKRSRGISSGPVSFLKIYNEAFRTIKQQGRHGANMAMMSIDHPDVLDFIRAKEVEGEINCFNISVKVTDEFMRKLIEEPDNQWYCTWKGERTKPHRVLRHSNGAVYGVEELDMTVRQIFDEIVSYAWLNGEPGIVFIDRVNETNPLPGMGNIVCSNPCGEQFLHPYDNCNLGSINLAKFVRDGRVDYKRLRLVSKVATRFLDNVIDEFDFPVPQVTELALKNRRIGLGIMGFADMLYQLGVKYDSDEGFAAAEKVMRAIQEASHEMSAELAEEKGVFPNYSKSVFKDAKVKMRNTATTTVAPTGSISMMFDASSGIEPEFALAYIKQDKDGHQYHYLNKYFDEELHRRGFSEEKINAIKEEAVAKGSIQQLTDLPQDLRNVFVTAMDISGVNHIKMQAAFQRHVDNSISKTINLPNSATKEDVKNSFILAWQLKCKCCTVYRDGSRVIQPLNLGSSEIVSMTEAPVKKLSDQPMNLPIDKGRIEKRTRPEALIGRTYKVKTGYGNLYVTVNNDEHGVPFEVFATIGKSGGFFQEQSEAICRLISLALRSGIKVENVIDQLKGIRGPALVMTERGTVLSLPDAIGQMLEEHVRINNHHVEELAIATVTSEAAESAADAPTRAMADFGFMPECPDCGAALKMAEGCISCVSCGFSRCF